ncbi:MAG: hypothetical protein COS99_04735, partial [Candidatus Omnitrophica bacterium CG07_land_8_20_14_0_80_42_15]
QFFDALTDSFESIGYSQTPEEFRANLDKFVALIADNEVLLSKVDYYTAVERAILDCLALGDQVPDSDEEWLYILKRKKDADPYFTAKTAERALSAAQEIMKAYEFVSHDDSTHVFLGGDGTYWYILDRLLRPGELGAKTRHHYISKLSLFSQEELEAWRKVAAFDNTSPDSLSYISHMYIVMGDMINTALKESQVDGKSDEKSFWSILRSKFADEMKKGERDVRISKDIVIRWDFRSIVEGLIDDFMGSVGSDEKNMLIYDIGTFGVQPLLLKCGVEYRWPHKNVAVRIKVAGGSPFKDSGFSWVDERPLDTASIEAHQFTQLDIDHRLGAKKLQPRPTSERLSAAINLLALYHVVQTEKTASRSSVSPNAIIGILPTAGKVVAGGIGEALRLLIGSPLSTGAMSENAVTEKANSQLDKLNAAMTLKLREAGKPVAAIAGVADINTLVTDVNGEYKVIRESGIEAMIRANGEKGIFRQFVLVREGNQEDMKKLGVLGLDVTDRLVIVLPEVLGEGVTLTDFLVETLNDERRGVAGISNDRISVAFAMDTKNTKGVENIINNDIASKKNEAVKYVVISPEELQFNSIAYNLSHIMAGIIISGSGKLDLLAIGYKDKNSLKELFKNISIAIITPQQISNEVDDIMNMVTQAESSA